MENVYLTIRHLSPGMKSNMQDYEGEWVDLRAAETVALKRGEVYDMRLGVSMILPSNYEAHITLRSSAFSKWRIMSVLGTKVIDPKFNAYDAEWTFPIMALEDTKIHKNDRICQFRVFKQQGHVMVKTEGDLRDGE